MKINRIDIEILRIKLARFFPTLNDLSDDEDDDDREEAPPPGPRKPIHEQIGGPIWQVAPAPPATQEDNNTAPNDAPDGATELNLQHSVWPALLPVAIHAENGPVDEVLSRRKPAADTYKQQQVQWKPGWANNKKTTTATTGSRGKPFVRTAPRHPRRQPKTRPLPLPPQPPPLPPCLQCVLHGTRCSLTTTPYAQAFVNDRVSAAAPVVAGPEGEPAQTTTTTRMTPWQIAYARLVRDCNATAAAAAADTSISGGDESADENTSADKVAHAAQLARRTAALQQQFLRQAVARGDMDSPLLPLPPVQCARCARRGDRACLQQSVDLTAGFGSGINVGSSRRSRRSRSSSSSSSSSSRSSSSSSNSSSRRGSCKEKTKMPLAWFATSGPPPLSLLPQHGRSLREQIHRKRSTVRRDSATGANAVVLEAIFCRDPSVLSAADVAAQAQVLLARIARQPNSSGHVPRPATAWEITNMLPRGSPLDVHACRGVATAAQLPGGCVSPEALDSTSPAHEASVPPTEIPRWRTNGPWRMQNNDNDEDTNDGTDARPSPPYKWQEYFLDVGEARAAREMRRAKPSQREGEEDAAPSSVVSSSTSPLATLPAAWRTPVSAPPPEYDMPTFDSDSDAGVRIAKRRAHLDAVRAGMDGEHAIYYTDGDRAAAAVETDRMHLSQQIREKLLADGEKKELPPLSSRHRGPRSWDEELQIDELAEPYEARFGSKRAALLGSVILDGRKPENKRPVRSVEELCAIGAKVGVPLERVFEQRPDLRERMERLKAADDERRSKQM
ncbi:hypothetical protein SPI_07017 [Niveomyces insectorum RCEF 264]|uniref:Uncharacterized protein n=1 Tax=Niveomyces insectorum RCEF 264 TaxID=1081102 RepID=A0A167Q707_9HYPO|nr:hypothetical protein SPI_07017 [Niveomyces insectorum RCEF 264]